MTTEAKVIHSPAAEWKEELEERIGEARERIEVAGENAIEFIKERPVLCLAGALAAGYLIGRLVRR